MFLLKRKLAVALAILMIFALTACVVPAPTPEKSVGENAADPNAPTEIVLSCGEADERFNSMVTAFNKSSSEYKVVFKDFGDETALAAAVVSGDGPDIFVGYLNPPNEFSDFAFVDLQPLIEGDEEYGADFFFESLYNTLTAEGHLYWLPTGFRVVTFYAPESAVGDPGRLTMTQAREKADLLGDDVYIFPGWMDRENLLSYMMDFFVSRYVDMSAGTCSFDSPDFAALLESCNDQIDHIVEGQYNEKAMSRRSLLERYWARGVWNLEGLNLSAGNDYSYVGFPNEGSNGSTFELGTLLAISAASDNQEGAWEFLRFVLSDEMQMMGDQFIPVSRRVVEKQIELGLAGELQTESFETVRITQKDADKLLRLIDETEYLSGRDEVIKNIIRDEAAAFFDGAKSAEETARVIQSRVSIYVAEQR